MRSSFTRTVIIILQRKMKYFSINDTRTSLISLTFIAQVYSRCILRNSTNLKHCVCIVSTDLNYLMTILFKFMEFPQFVKDRASFVGAENTRVSICFKYFYCQSELMFKYLLHSAAVSPERNSKGNVFLKGRATVSN